MTTAVGDCCGSPKILARYLKSGNVVCVCRAFVQRHPEEFGVVDDMERRT